MVIMINLTQVLYFHLFDFFDFFFVFKEGKKSSSINCEKRRRRAPLVKFKYKNKIFQ